MSMAHSVFIVPCPDYSQNTLQNVFVEAGTNLGLSGNISGKKILIKPNLISARGTGLACTHPFFIQALAAWCLDEGATVFVGDSPAFGKASTVLKQLGIYNSLVGMGAEICDFSMKREKVLSCGVKVGIAEEVFNCDLLLNVPKIKAHGQMYVTMGLKNIFGIVQGIQKGFLHMQHGNGYQKFSQIILDLQECLPQNVTIADGIEVMHQSGPIDGNPLFLENIFYAENPVALDTAIMKALQLDYKRSPLLVEARRRGVLGSQLTDIDFPCLPPSALFGSGFEAPLQLSPVRFSPFRFLLGQLKRFFLKLQGC